MNGGSARFATIIGAASRLASQIRKLRVSALYQVGQKVCSHLRLVPTYRFSLSAADSKMLFILLATVSCAPSTRTMSRLTREHNRVLVNW